MPHLLSCYSTLSPGPHESQGEAGSFVLPDVMYYQHFLSLQGTCGHLQHEHMGPEAFWQAHMEKSRHLCIMKYHSILKNLYITLGICLNWNLSK